MDLQLVQELHVPSAAKNGPPLIAVNRAPIVAAKNGTGTPNFTSKLQEHQLQEYTLLQLGVDHQQQDKRKIGLRVPKRQSNKKP